MTSGLRIEPVDPVDPTIDPDTRRRLERVRVHYDGELHTAQALIANNAAMYRGWLTLGSQILMRGSLSARHRELIILRTAHNTAGTYEWAGHLPAARAAGITDDEIADLATTDPTSFTGIERCLVEATDQLATAHRIADVTWQQLADAFPPATLVEIPIVVGHYTMTAYTLRSLGLEAP